MRAALAVTAAAMGQQTRPQRFRQNRSVQSKEGPWASQPSVPIPPGPSGRAGVGRTPLIRADIMARRSNIGRFKVDR